MTREDVIRMAREAYGIKSSDGFWREREVEFLERFAVLVAAAEREACARVCEDVLKEDNEAPFEAAADMCAAAIRKRGTE